MSQHNRLLDNATRLGIAAAGNSTLEKAAINADIALLERHMANGMSDAHRGRAVETINRLRTNGRRFNLHHQPRRAAC